MLHSSSFSAEWIEIGQDPPDPLTPRMPGLGNQQSPMGVWGRGSRLGDKKRPDSGVTETQRACETASKFCHLSASLSAKGNLKLSLRGLQTSCGQPPSQHTAAGGRPLTLLGFSSELTLLRTSSTRGTRMEIQYQELLTNSKVGEGAWSLRWKVLRAMVRPEQVTGAIPAVAPLTLLLSVMSVGVSSGARHREFNSIG